MRAIAVPSVARGLATAYTIQRPAARGIHGAAGGRSQLCTVPQRASTCSAVAATSSGNCASIQAGVKAAIAQANLVAASKSPAQLMWLAAAAVSVVVAVKVLHSLSKQEFEDLCQDKQPAASMKELSQPAAVLKELCRESRELNRRLAVSVAFIAVACIVQHALFGVADDCLSLVAVQLYASILTFRTACKSILVFCMARQAKASIGGQQPGMP